ncbi:MAG: tryptophan synthase subunit alpha [Syntrophobacterales bacterium]|nr:tryptophan synthase subunit alpha [Syntrophobacterales bacterium]
MNRIDQAFKQLKAKGGKALIPFITAGDPDLATTRALALEMAARGADILELGIPFSDPLADGPTIQAASLRAMQAGVHLEDVIKLAGSIRQDTQIPLILMGYYNPILQYGLERTAADAAAHGVDGFIIPDLPMEEAGPWRVAAAKAGIANIFLAAPTSGADRIKHLARLTKGFLYYVSVTGITGARTELPADLAASLQEVRALVKGPLAVGFGISTPEQVAWLAPYVDGVVVGSAIVQRVAKLKGPELIREIGDFIAGLKAPLRGQ